MTRLINGWRLPLRLAIRDLRRYKGRSVLAGLLIFLPLLVISGAATGVSTFDRSPAEKAAVDFAHADGRALFGTGEPKVALPGMPEPLSQEKPPTLAAVRAAGGGDAVLMSHSPVRVQRDGGPPEGMTYHGVEGNAPIRDAVYTVASGRAPKADDEVLVTPNGLGAGLPTSGTVTVTGTDGVHHQLHIVGVAHTFETDDLIGVKHLPADLASYSALVKSVGNAARWTSYGAMVETRRSLTSETGNTALASRESAFTLAIATMLVIAVIALLAGPAFAASATRARRTLGIIAANGGTRSLLRRLVLIQALVLGVVAGALGILVGALIGATAALNLHRLRPSLLSGPLDIPWNWLLALLAVVAVASIVASLAPAVAAGRTNLLQALRGQVSPRRVRTGMPVLGAVGVIGGVALLFIAARQVNEGTGMGYPEIILGIPLFFIGAVLIVPWVLNQFGRMASVLPVTVRIAVRDVSRQRTRATAAVGAVLAAATGLSAIGTFALSLVAHDERTYIASAPLGAMTVSGYELAPGTQGAATPSEIKSFRTNVSNAVPGLVTSLITTAGHSPEDLNPDKPLPGPVTKMYFDVKACTADAVAASPGNALGSLTARDTAPNIAVVPLTAARRLGLTASEMRTLTSGGMLIVPAGPQTQRFGVDTSRGLFASQVHNGHVSVSAVTMRDLAPMGSGGFGAKHLSCATSSLPAQTTTNRALTQLQWVGRGAALVLDTTANQHAWPTDFNAVLLTKPDGISHREERLIKGQTATGGYSSEVERGFRSYKNVITGVLSAFAAAVMLMSAVISTLLSQAESRAESATMAAVGAARSMRRRVAAAHAAAICVIGSLIGFALGFGPGIVLARTNTTRDLSSGMTLEPIVVLPWAALGITLIVVPLVAAAVVAVAVGRTPTLTRREA